VLLEWLIAIGLNASHFLTTSWTEYTSAHRGGYSSMSTSTTSTAFEGAVNSTSLAEIVKLEVANFIPSA
jgi:hypothetical protein